jgi:cytochrome c5
MKKNSFAPLLGRLAAMAVVVALLSHAVEAREQGADAEAIAKRLAPIGQVNVGKRNAPPAAITEQPVAEVTPKDTEDKGKGVYDSACFICHTSGTAGAPRLGDKEAWAPRIAQGGNVLVSHAINGFQGSAGLMPPRGGRSDLTDEDIKAAVAYMVKASQ